MKPQTCKHVKYIYSLHAGPQELETSKQLFCLTIHTIPQETTHTICDAGMNLNKWAILRVMLVLDILAGGFTVS